MKLNNKGFMMAEVVVVSAVVILTLTALYISYNKIYSAYKTRLTYNDVSTLYRLAYYKDYLEIDEENLDDIKTQARNGDGTIFIISSSVEDDEYITNNNYVVCKEGNDSNCVESLALVYRASSTSNITLTGVNPTFSAFADYVSSSAKTTSTSLLLMEKCDVDAENKPVNCKYAYMEV